MWCVFVSKEIVVKWDLERIPPLIEREYIQVRYDSTYLWQCKGLCELYASRHSLILDILLWLLCFSTCATLDGSSVFHTSSL